MRQLLCIKLQILHLQQWYFALHLHLYPHKGIEISLRHSNANANEKIPNPEIEQDIPSPSSTIRMQRRSKSTQETNQKIKIEFRNSYPLEVRRRVDVPSRVVIILQRALERIRCSSRRNTPVLLLSDARATSTVSHQSIIVIFRLLAAPDSPCYHEETSKDGCSSDTNHDPNDGILGLGAHARR